jgi:DNA-binding NtrC family response regulator
MNDSDTPRPMPETESVDLEGSDRREQTGHLLVIDHVSARRLVLPDDCMMQIGRSPEADIQIDSPAVSRQHAKLILSGGIACLTDQGSHNGTLVNGERINGSVTLSAGDTIAIGETILVLGAGPRSAPCALADIDQIRQRLEEEIARAKDYSRTFAVLVLPLNLTRGRVGLAAAAMGVLRGMDVIAVHGPRLIVLLPEVGGEAARNLAQSVLTATEPWLAIAHGGLASYPVDGCDIESLLAGATAAARWAPGGCVSLVSELPLEHEIGGRRIVITGAAMVGIYELIRRLAPSDLSVLILGEAGTGKENAANALHEWSPRANRPFVPVNCAAIPASLVESEFFGHEKGAFSDARVAKVGLLESASGGTVFLDEVGDLSLDVQAKLLRALEQMRIKPVGSTRERDVVFRLVAATNRDLDEAVRMRLFREDLLARIRAATVELPALRYRLQEVPVLARLFVRCECEKMGRAELTVAEATIVQLANYPFPGNIRELKNALRFAVAVADGPTIHPWHLPKPIATQGINVAERPALDVRSPTASTVPEQFQSLADEIRDLERARMTEALQASGGVQTRAAALIGMPIRTFTLKLKQYKIVSRDSKHPE